VTASVRNELPTAVSPDGLLGDENSEGVAALQHGAGRTSRSASDLGAGPLEPRPQACVAPGDRHGD